MLKIRTNWGNSKTWEDRLATSSLISGLVAAGRFDTRSSILNLCDPFLLSFIPIFSQSRSRSNEWRTTSISSWMFVARLPSTPRKSTYWKPPANRLDIIILSLSRWKNADKPKLLLTKCPHTKVVSNDQMLVKSNGWLLSNSQHQKSRQFEQETVWRKPRGCSKKSTFSSCRATSVSAEWLISLGALEILDQVWYHMTNSAGPTVFRRELWIIARKVHGGNYTKSCWRPPFGLFMPPLRPNVP